jgi:hypothetical protein
MQQNVERGADAEAMLESSHLQGVSRGRIDIVAEQKKFSEPRRAILQLGDSRKNIPKQFSLPQRLLIEWQRKLVTLDGIGRVRTIRNV